METETSGAITTDQGEPVQFIGSKYIGKKGWLDTSKGCSNSRQYVIVDIGDGKLPRTHVQKKNVVKISEVLPPDSYEQAVLQQQPNIKIMMDKLAQELVRCHITIDEHHDEIVFFFVESMSAAEEKQESLGGKALWRHIEYTYPDNGVE